ncbi:MAG: low-specificity L-threonine aldolase [Deltaproteobacteria bacterium]|nr:low-specificity L-threonine aldolase [Deltaproteobacteria bacterium]
MARESGDESEPRSHCVAEPARKVTKVKNVPIDLRSDTVTRPSAAMRAAMAAAEVGDDVYGEDPSVNRLEAMAAGMLGKEAAVFVCSGTQSNLIALLAHCERGDEYVVGQQAHTYKYEGGGAAVLGGIQPQPLDLEPDGSLDLRKVEAAIKPDDPHFARTRLLCLENTQAGKALPLEYLRRAREFTAAKRLGIHLDGARIFNAAVHLGVPVGEISRHFDSVSVCLSKGLGAPVGSVLCGPRDLVAGARRWRKVVGGGMRQAGVLAAAGIYALEHNVERLAEDHENARALADGLSRIDEVSVAPEGAQTNMVFASVAPQRSAELRAYLGERGMRIGAGPGTIRLVTHLDVDRGDIGRFVEAVAGFFSGSGLKGASRSPRAGYRPTRRSARSR